MNGDDRMTIPLTRAERWAFCCIVVADLTTMRSPIVGEYLRSLRKDGTPRKSYHWHGQAEDL